MYVHTYVCMFVGIWVEVRYLSPICIYCLKGGEVLSDIETFKST